MSKQKPRAWVRVSHRTKELHPSKQRWEVIYSEPGHKQRTKGGFPTKASAEDWADDFLSKTRHGQSWIDPKQGDITFRDMARLWFNAQHFERSHTAHHYRRMIEGSNNLMETFGDVPIGVIANEAVASYIKQTAARLAPQTVRHRFYVLRTVLDFAVFNQRLHVNPARSISPKSLPSPKKMHVHEEQRYPLTSAETERIIAAMPEPYDMFTRLAAYTGMRPEEVTGLRLTDVDLDEGTVFVRTVVVEANGHVTREEATKTAKSRRVIDLDTRTLNELETYVAAHRKRAAQWFAEHPDHPHPGEALPLFVGLAVGGRSGDPDIQRLDYSKPMRYGSFYKRHWRKATEAAGLPPIRFYDLRHADVSRHVDRIGQDGAFTLKEIQERYGHSSAVMTLDRYAHSGKPDRVARRRALDAMQAEETATNVTPITSKTKRTG